jgi:hypothetical protein
MGGRIRHRYDDPHAIANTHGAKFHLIGWDMETGAEPVAVLVDSDGGYQVGVPATSLLAHFAPIEAIGMCEYRVDP